MANIVLRCLPWCLASFGWFQPAAEATAVVAASPAERLLVVSIDGLGWQRLQPQLPRLPVLRRLVEGGVAGPLRSVFPSMTWAAHTAIATGTTPGRNGVLGNRFVDRARHTVVESWSRDRSLNRAVALWDVAKQAGWTTAALLWPQTSRSAALDWNVPEVYGQGAFEKGSTPGLLAQLQREAGLPANQLGRFGHDEKFLLDSWLRDAAVWLVERSKPKLTMLHFLSVDTYAHAHGPDSVDARWGLQLVDSYLGAVLAAYEQAGLRDRLAVCIVSDHGFLQLTQGFAAQEVLAEAVPRSDMRGLIAFATNGQAIFVYGKGRAHGGEPLRSQGAHPRPVDVALAAFLSRAAKREEVEAVIPAAEFGVYGLGDAAANADLPDAIVLLKPHVAPLPAASVSVRKLSMGGHGYLPDHPDLQGTFILHGPGVRAAATVSGMRAIDVAPTLAGLVGWAWPQQVDGAVRSEVFIPARR